MGGSSRASAVILVLVVVVCGNSAQNAGTNPSGAGSNGNLRVCVVEGKGLYKKAGRYCPIVEKSPAKVECVIGIDRLDCLRRISKGSVDFGVFSSEDLLAARWADVDVLVTDELRFHSAPFEYEVVAIVDNRSGIKGLEDLRGARLCHPGYGYEADWTETLANFFEATIIPRNCDKTLSVFEDRLRASAEYFSASCKAGPWVADRVRDRTLKSLYPSLCSLCYNANSCSTSDKYWGRRGPLHCISEEAGSVAWARLDDTKLHFGLSGATPTADPVNFSYLCKDGSLRQIANNTTPCVWIAKPWPVIAAKRQSSAAVSLLAKSLSHQSPSSWQSALLSLVEMYHVSVVEVQPELPVNDYLSRAIGFQSANSLAECSPPRSLKICTSSIVSQNKCNWLAETSRAHGLEPQLDCLRPMNMTEESCLEAVARGQAEIVMVNPNMQLMAKRKYDLYPILFETTPIMNDLYVVVAIVKTNSDIRVFENMRNKRACFPQYDGVAWHSVIHYFKTQNLFKTKECPFDSEMSDFFSNVCAPGYTGGNMKLKEICGTNKDYDGEVGALRCLVDGKADVAFVSLRTLRNTSAEVTSVEPWTRNLDVKDFRTICPLQNSQYCFISWSSLGQMMIRSNSSQMRTQEIINTFKHLDQTFGKNYRSQTTPFMMYGPFDHKHDVIFQDRTKMMKTISELTENRMPYNYEIMLKENRYGECVESNYGNTVHNKIQILLFLSLLHVLICKSYF